MSAGLAATLRELFATRAPDDRRDVALMHLAHGTADYYDLSELHVIAQRIARADRDTLRRAAAHLAQDALWRMMQDKRPRKSLPPTVGSRVRALRDARANTYGPAVTVTALRDHCPVDGTREPGVLADLSDGTTEFIWNLERIA